MSNQTLPANQKFAIGNTINWKGHEAKVVAVETDTPWPNYTVECANGTHVLEFADQSFCTLISE